MVMYRDFAVRMARARNLLGYVQNLSDGTVRVVVEGERPALDTFVKKLRTGPMLAQVQRLDIITLPATEEFDSFVILRDSA